MLGYSILGQGRSTLPGVCQFLSSVYQRLLQDHNTVNNPDLQRQAAHSGHCMATGPSGWKVQVHNLVHLNNNGKGWNGMFSKK